jgi:hypothetical protein
MVALVAAAVGFSCGTPELANGHIEGQVLVSGPLQGAVVSVWVVDADGVKTTEKPAAVAPATDADGRFAADVGPIYGDVLLEVEGGGATYTEVASGEKVTLDPGVALTAVLVDFSPGESRTKIAVTPVSTMAVALAMARRALGKEATFRAAINKAHALLGQHFLEIDLGTTMPSLPTTGDASLTVDVRYGLVLASLSALAHAIAAESDLTADSVNTATLTKKLADDLSSSEALFDGTGPGDGALILGACPHPPGCTGDACRTLCDLSANTPRARLAAALVDGFLNRAVNQTGITFEDVTTRLEAMRTNTEPELFPEDMPPEASDSEDPQVAIVTPLSAAVVDGMIAIEATATDNTRVQSLTVAVGGTAGPADTDPADGRYLAMLDTTALQDGALVIEATATDSVGRTATAMVSVQVNNQGPKQIAGSCVKGPLRLAAVRAYAFAGGEKGAQLGAEAQTDSDGHWALEIEDYAGPVLIECGGPNGTYDEEAFVAEINLSAGDFLRTIVPDFDDSQNYPEPVAVTAWTSIATSYLEWLISDELPVTNPATLTARWATAFGWMESHLQVLDLPNTEPVILGPAVTTFTDASRYALANAGLSQLAVRFAAENGAILPGASVNASKVWLKLQEDVSDGCLDGKGPGGATLTVVGVAIGDDAMRYGLAEAMAKYMVGPLNSSALDNPADAIDYLDHLSLAGSAGLEGPEGSCANGRLWPNAGDVFDREPPDVIFDEPPTPLAGAIVGGTIMVKAHGADLVTAAPVTTWVLPAGLADGDGLPGNEVVIATIDTKMRPEGPLTIRARSVDGAGREGFGERSLTIDNTKPVVAITGVNADEWRKTDPTIGVSVTELHPESVDVRLDGAAMTAPFQVTTSGAHTVTASATDKAGNTGIAPAKTFYLDKQAPTISIVSGPAAGSAQRGMLTFVAEIDDGMKAIGPGSLPAVAMTLDATVTGAGGPSVTKVLSALPDKRVRLEVTVTTTAANDGGLTVTFSGQDRAGNAAPSAARTLTVDNTAPTLTLAAIPAWVNAPPSASGSLSDATTTTLTVTAGGLNYNETAGGGTWSATPPAGSVLPNGAYTLVASATDAAGNTTTKQLNFSVDNDGPEIVVNVNQVEDEQTLTVTFNPMTAAPSLSGTAIGGAQLGAAGTPKIKKYQTRMSGKTIADNPIEVRFTPSDPGGSGLASLSYTVSLPDGAVLGPFPAAAPSQAGMGTHAAFVTTTEVPPAPPALLSRLETLPGAWSVTLEAVDTAGNQTTVTVPWQHVPLAAPVEIVKVGGAVADPLAANHAWTGHKLETNSIANALVGTMGKKSIVRYRLRNGSDRDVYVGFFVPAPTTAKYDAQRVDKSADLGNAVIPSAACAQGINKTWRQNSDGTITCNGQGWSTPVSSAPIASGTYSVASLVTNVGVYQTSGAVQARCTAAQGCLTTVGANTYYEFVIPGKPAGQTSPTDYWISVETDDFHEFWPIAGVITDTMTMLGVTMTGRTEETWAKCVAQMVDPVDGLICTSAKKMQRYQALHWAKVTLTNFRVHVRARTNTASVVTAADNDDLRVSPYTEADETMAPLNYANADYVTCEGTWNGSTCTPALPGN